MIGALIMGWRERNHEETYTDSEVEERLKEELPHWYLEKGWIRRFVQSSMKRLFLEP